MRKKILLIDDDKFISKAITMILTQKGFEITVVNTGTEGLEAITKSEFDLVLLDIFMPDVLGTFVLGEIRKTKEKNVLPVIMISSCEDDTAVVNALEQGANDYVTKPINFKILEARIGTQLELRNLSLEFASKKELAAVTAMIATYNHEINNPLSIAIGTLEAGNIKSLIPEKEYTRLEKSLVRIKDIVKKIDKVSDDNSLSFEDYTRSSKMIKVS